MPVILLTSVLFFTILFLKSSSLSQNPPATLTPAELQAENGKRREALNREVDKGYAAWLAEKDPVKKESIRATTGFVGAAIRADRTEIVSAVARGGPEHQNLISIPEKFREIKLTEKFSLNGTGPDSSPSEDLVYRRISQHRLEVWSKTDGWLFNDNGRLLHHVKVPRRDGSGREWHGAFLPNGLWITTDLWDQDQQINCFSPNGKWLWELSGKTIGAPAYPGSTEITKALIGWGRADREGSGWLASVGADYLFKTIWINPEGKWKPVQQSQQWAMVFPRSMGMRLTQHGRLVPSDDNSLFMFQQSTSHGAFAANPCYGVKDRWDVFIPDGGYDTFGFWPHSYRCYVEAGGPLLWFFDSRGIYQGEIQARYFADAENGRDLLLLLEDNRILRLTPQLQVAGVRRYLWSKEEQAKPLAIFDDINLGFFKRGGEGNQEVVLAAWPAK